MNKPTDTIELYAWLKTEISKLEDELDAIKDDVMKAVQSKDGELETDAFTLKTVKRPKYKFSAAYDAKNDELKNLKKEEIEKGIAVIDGYSEFVKINFAKS